jgi:hypothetical protein
MMFSFGCWVKRMVRANLESEAQTLRDAVTENEHLALQAQQSGDLDTARFYAEQANQTEQDYFQVATQSALQAVFRSAPTPRPRRLQRKLTTKKRRK